MPASDYIARLPRLLLEEFDAGRWLPIVGSGMSANARVAANGRKPPTWKDLGLAVDRYLGEDSGSTPDPIDSISMFEQEYGRPALIDRIRDELLVADATPTRTNLAFAGINFDIVVTTNVDYILEAAWVAKGWPYDVIVGEQRLTSRRLPNTTQLIKFHGDLNHPTELVLTEQDYDSFLAKSPMLVTYLSSLLITRVPVLIGYSLEDADFRSVLTSIANRLGENRPAPWVILAKTTPRERARFERRGVRVASLDSSSRDRGKVLGQLFEQLQSRLQVSASQSVQASSDAVLTEMKLPTAQPTQGLVVFYSVGGSAVDQALLFGFVEDLGLIPVALESVRNQTPTFTLASRADLLRRASVVVVDIRDGSEWRDIRLSMMQVSRSRLIVICTVEQSDLLRFEEVHVVLAPPVSVDGIQISIGWAQQFAATVENVASRDDARGAPDQTRSLDPTVRFLQAVVAVEAELRRRSSGQDAPKVGVRQLARRSPDLSEPDVEVVMRSYEIRSQILHLGATPQAQTLEPLTVELLKILGRLRNG